jgi:hypothetical protein
MVESLFEDSAFRLDLQSIIDMLPLAAAASAKMRARRDAPAAPRLQYLRDLGTDKTFLLFDGTNLRTISWNSEGSEDHFALVPAQPFTTIDELFDIHLESGGGVLWEMVPAHGCGPM